MDGVCIVTGANAGIGKEVVAGLMRQHRHVVMACRDRDRCMAAKRDLDSQFNAASGPRGSCECASLDLSQPESIRSFAQQFASRKQSLCLLVNNAGVMGMPLDPDGSDPHLRINHLGPFLLTHLLAPHMPPGSRIVNVASRAHYQGLVTVDAGRINGTPGNWYSAYARSKLCNVLHVAELQRRLRPVSVSAYAVSPGRVATGIFDNVRPQSLRWLLRPLARRFFQTPAQGAATVLVAATGTLSADALYLHDSKVAEPSAAARDPALARDLWDASMAVTEAW